jgi:thymidylate kinase
MARDSGPILLTFSGIDGAGKSTQIERLCSHLRQERVLFDRLTMWDDVVLFPHLRANLSHRVLDGERGVGTPERPVRRSDKNVRHWYLTLVRAGLYIADALRLRSAVAQTRALRPRVIIFDRYLYDQLANIPLNRWGRLYIQILLKIAPRPDTAFLLDADPEAALRRKPEYPLGFMREYRQAYLDLQAVVPEMFVVPAGDVDTVERWIAREIGVHHLLHLPAGKSQKVSRAGAAPGEEVRYLNLHA